MVGDVPIEGLGQLECGSFLAFEAIWVHGVEQVDVCGLDDLREDAHAAIEVCLDLAGDGAEIHGLG